MRYQHFIGQVKEDQAIEVLIKFYVKNEPTFPGNPETTAAKKKGFVKHLSPQNGRKGLLEFQVEEFSDCKIS